MTAQRPLPPGCPQCIVCGERCIPLADFDDPTCIKCDDDMARAVRVRANFELAPAVRTLWDGLPTVTGCGTPAGYVTHVKNGEAPCWACRHFMDVALQNTIAWTHAREQAEGDEAA